MTFLLLSILKNPAYLSSLGNAITDTLSWPNWDVHQLTRATCIKRVSMFTREVVTLFCGVEAEQRFCERLSTLMTRHYGLASAAATLSVPTGQTQTPKSSPIHRGRPLSVTILQHRTMLHGYTGRLSATQPGLCSQRVRLGPPGYFQPSSCATTTR